MSRVVEAMRKTCERIAVAYAERQRGVAEAMRFHEPQEHDAFERANAADEIADLIARLKEERV